MGGVTVTEFRWAFMVMEPATWRGFRMLEVHTFGRFTGFAWLMGTNMTFLIILQYLITSHQQIAFASSFIIVHHVASATIGLNHDWSFSLQ